ncbi:MAG TPA: hypothetical protein VF719_07195 [Abditibacteriaceae bacterium]
MKYQITIQRASGKTNKEHADTSEAAIDIITAHLEVALRCNFGLKIKCESVRESAYFELELEAVEHER